MRAYRTRIHDVMVFEPTVFEDGRGYFFESFNEQRFKEATGESIAFVQDNQSRSGRGVLRGLHFQVAPKAQGKLVRVLSGEIFDVAVDLRRDSSSFGSWVGEVLSSENRKQLWIPAGFAHGFQVLSDVADVFYKATDFYSPHHERSIRWDDRDLAIQWPDRLLPNVSEKDACAPSFSEYVAHSTSSENLP